jgi:hypothetical protein
MVLCRRRAQAWSFKILLLVNGLCSRIHLFFHFRRQPFFFFARSLASKKTKGAVTAPSPAGDAAMTVPASSPREAAASEKRKKSKKKNKEEEAPVTPVATPAATTSTTHADAFASASASAPLSTSKRSASNDELDDLFSTIKKRKAEVKG